MARKELSALEKHLERKAEQQAEADKIAEQGHFGLARATYEHELHPRAEEAPEAEAEEETSSDEPEGEPEGEPDASAGDEE